MYWWYNHPIVSHQRYFSNLSWYLADPLQLQVDDPLSTGELQFAISKTKNLSYYIISINQIIEEEKFKPSSYIGHFGTSLNRKRKNLSDNSSKNFSDFGLLFFG